MQGAVESGLEGAEVKSAQLEAQLAACQDRIREMNHRHEEQLIDLQEDHR